MHTRRCRQKVGKNFKIFNNTPDRGKSVRKKNQNNSRIYLENACFILRITLSLFIQAESSFFNVNCNLFLRETGFSKDMKSTPFIPKTLCKSLYVSINFLHVQKTCWIQS